VALPVLNGMPHDEAGAARGPLPRIDGVAEPEHYVFNR
jgi:hypothetical protein